MVIVNIAAVIITAVTSTFFLLDFNTGLISEVSINVIIGVTLILSVIQMRKMIKATKFAFPNEKFVILHLINYGLWLLLHIVQSACMLKYLSLLKKGYEGHTVDIDKWEYVQDIVLTVSNTYKVYMNTFLLYLIVRFAKENK